MIVIMGKQRFYQVGLLVVLLLLVVCLWLVSRNQPALHLVNTPGAGAPPAGQTSPPGADGKDASEVAATVAAPAGTDTADAFSEYRLERDKARSAQIELLRGAAQDDRLSEERRAQLADELLQLLKKGEQEVQAETLLAARGFPQAVVVLTKGGATVIVPGILTQEGAARVGELISRVCSVSPESISIMDAAGQP